MNKLKYLAAAVVAWLALAPQAQAAWLKAETERFVVYGEGRESKVREYAEKLTAFDATLRLFHPSTRERPANTKVQVILVDSGPDLRRIRPQLPRQVAGWYIAMNEGVFAAAVTSVLGADDTLFHEYAHHFMLENFPAAYPAWFVEGFAEYFMTAEVTPAGVKVGNFNPARAQEIFGYRWLPWDELLSKRNDELKREQRYVYYAQSWLLMHYMRAAPERAVLLDKAITAIGKGEPPAQAFWTATGYTSDQLTRDLKAYRKLGMMLAKPTKAPPAIQVTRLPDSADALLLDNLRLVLSATGQVDADFLAGVRRKAARYPGDLFAEMTLARAEFVMGDPAAGEAIVKRLLAAHPDDREVLILAGTGHILTGMRNPAVRQAQYRAARPLFAKAYAADKKDFRPLYGYTFSRSIEREFPTDNDLNALIEARTLAPAVQENAVRAGLALLQRGRREDAAAVLQPVLNNPHGGRASAQAKALLEGKSEKEADAAAATASEEEAPAPPPPEPPKPAKVGG